VTQQQLANLRPFQPGNPGGPGRPVGSRTAFSAGFLRDLAQVWQEHGPRYDGPYGQDPAGHLLCCLRSLQSDIRITLLITDVGLPGGINGRQVADAARAIRPDLKILFITGFAENAAIGHGHLDPGMQVMAKPFVMAALANKARELMEG
jgi:hypothetical protein